MNIKETRTLLTTSFANSFDQDLAPGKVIGHISPDGIHRGGVDVERVISSDHGALRIQPLLKPGWRRSGLAYGPYRRENGLSFGVHILNGHNTSQVGDLNQSLARRLYRWAVSSGVNSIPRRLLAWGRIGHKRRTLQQFRRWAYLNRHFRHVENGVLDENLAIGWFAAEVPDNPIECGNAFVVHATGAENGELWVRSAGKQLPALRGLQNVPIYYFVVLREQGAAYYAASLPGAHGLGAFPLMRPLAIDTFDDELEVYASIYQSVLGQIGFRVDTRVYGTAVQKLPELDSWYGTAHLADTLTGNGLLAGSKAEKGGAWCVYRGEFERSPEGVQSLATENLAVLKADEPVGLVNVLVDMPVSNLAMEIVWRFQDESNFWSLTFGGSSCRLLLHHDGNTLEIAHQHLPDLLTVNANAVQILDDGHILSAYLNGHLLFNKRFADERLQAATGVGLRTKLDGAIGLRNLEAHPRAIPIPSSFDFMPPWTPGETAMVVLDNFQGPIGDLQGHQTGFGEKIWEKSFGLGRIHVQGDAAKVMASASNPNPGRTIYSIPWEDITFGDLEVEITPPGSKRGEWESCRSGLVFWQDEANQLIVNTWLDDLYQGASISSFFHLNGNEEIYDAVWTNVGPRIYWGRSYRLRVVFDGVQYLVFVNDEPVLMRALTDVYPNFNRLTINRVGILANWEWGNDTGSVFNQFVARKRI